ncbi:PhzF family isomerase [Sporolactobacillus pectinivorans]|uniref:PhzF family isomerase n=1 Tax=Sporolactobacillus pectinivorans TaxID=1591408 RepID=UPI000C2664C5|nr:PhzF family isomerase [Sporolactobacillus pectinivorans]
MKKYHLYQIDSFTKDQFKGNPAGVITNADGLSEDDMQRIARELNNSETAFIFSSDNDAYEAYIRFFTPLKEVPSCGHATIAAHYARALENKLDTSRIYHKIGAGILPVEILKKENDYKIVMTQGKIEFGPFIDGKNKEVILSALGITKGELLKGHPIEIVSTGHSKVMIGIKNQYILNRLKPNYDRLARLSEVIKCNGFYVYTLDSDDQDILVHGRMFAPAIGINEDPVTGNANGPLGAYLVHHQLVKHNDSLFTFKAKQGEKIGRAGIIEIEVHIHQAEPVTVKIAGNAVIVFQSELII